MRHLVKGRKLSRTASHRKATLSSLAVALIMERRIRTTVAKAKELRGYVEPLITRAKTDSTHNRRQVFAKLRDKYAVTELFEEVGPKAKDRPGGYTRVLKLGFRQGDSAEMAMIELVDYNDAPPEKQTAGKKRTRRAGRSTGSDAAQAASRKGEPKVKEESPKSPEESAEVQASAAEVTDVEEGKPEVQDGSREESVEKSVDFKVAEVKEKLESMDLETAKAFVEGDERVTVQKEIEKKITGAEEEK